MEAARVARARVTLTTAIPASLATAARQPISDVDRTAGAAPLLSPWSFLTERKLYRNRANESFLLATHDVFKRRGGSTV